MATKRKSTSRKSDASLDGHEDFYKRLRDRVTLWSDRNEIKPAYRQYLLALPDLFHLVARLALDRRVDTISKTILGVALAYAVSPFDLLPDFLGPLGFVDDLLVIALALEAVLLRVPRSVVNQHWAGEGDIVQLVRQVREAADTWVGRGMYLRIREYLAEHGIGAKAAGAVATARKTARKAAGAVRTAGRTAATAASRRVRAAAKSAAAPAASGRKKAAAGGRKKTATAARKKTARKAPAARAKRTTTAPKGRR